MICVTNGESPVERNSAIPSDLIVLHSIPWDKPVLRSMPDSRGGVRATGGVKAARTR